MKGKHFFKAQTAWISHPATIHGEVLDNRIELETSSSFTSDPDGPLCHRLRRDASITLTPHEALALAAWLSDAAERINARRASADARKAARRAAKGGGR